MLRCLLEPSDSSLALRVVVRNLNCMARRNLCKPRPPHAKDVRLHRPMQLNNSNSVSAAGIWCNVLMGSRAERSLDLERLHDLIHTEVKNLRQRKLQGNYRFF